MESSGHGTDGTMSTEKRKWEEWPRLLREGQGMLCILQEQFQH